ncbi:MAG: hypothetical protein K1X51_11645 [Rhodospirillaceae bacterium]|nr:hypothetical protein [Rhodospirillaceae bacterium]
MSAIQASSHIIRLSNHHGVEPLGVVGLLAVTALVEVDFVKLRFWKQVADEIAAATAAAA